jgi:hypothetical protein
VHGHLSDFFRIHTRGTAVETADSFEEQEEAVRAWDEHSGGLMPVLA